MNDNYAGPERRVQNLTEDRVALMIEEAVSDAMTRHEAKMGAMIRNEFNTLQELFKSAYPGGDPHGHRIAHEKAIASASKWDRLRDGIIEKILTGGVWAGVIFLAFTMWEAFKREVHR